MSHIDLMEMVLDTGVFLFVCIVVLVGGLLATWGVKQPEPDSEATTEQYLHRQERGND